MNAIPNFQFYPLTPERWPDLEELFRQHRTPEGCWCMWWRVSRADFYSQASEGNRLAFKQIVTGGAPTGVLAYQDRKAVGWCAVAPRADYPALNRSRLLKAIDDRPVWSITCFFILPQARRQGLMVSMIEAAVAYAGANGARIVEGYPYDPGQEKIDSSSIYMGLPSAFLQVGFAEVIRRSPTRPIMRIQIGE